MLSAALLLLMAAPRPAVKPEPRSAIPAAPLTIARNLLSPSPTARAAGARQLGLPDPIAPVRDLRLFFVNLDEDEELEAILQVAFGGSWDALILVLDQAGGRWFRVGEFTNPSPHGSPEIELKEVVQHGALDILLRLHPSGTDIAVWTELSIYRMLRGRLYRVFGVTEETEARAMGPATAGPWINTRETVYYPEREEGQPVRIVVHRTEAVLGDDIPLTGGGVAARSKPAGCAVWRWDQATFRFVRDQAAAARYCDSRTRRPRD